ncbi:DUF3853 family protein [Bacteroides thetaiotaomicron]|uniref:DUF3853 family protein n=1 Tax=Bacteroides thetaiotaomicron TaxID=818 RepID=UPI00356AC39F
MTDLNKRVIDLTAGELLELIQQGYKPQVVVDTTKDNKRFVYGLAGIAGLFGCSKTTANRIKQSGRIDGAITQVGSLIIVDAEKALELVGKKVQRYTRKK